MTADESNVLGDPPRMPDELWTAVLEKVDILPADLALLPESRADAPDDMDDDAIDGLPENALEDDTAGGGLDHFDGYDGGSLWVHPDATHPETPDDHG